MTPSETPERQPGWVPPGAIVGQELLESKMGVVSPLIAGFEPHGLIPIGGKDATQEKANDQSNAPATG